MMQSDRHLGQRLSGNLPAIWGALIAGGLAAFAYVMGLQTIPHTLLTIPIAIAFGYLVGKAIGFVALEGAGRTAQSIHMPAAAGSYTFTHSHIDTMETRGDHAGAARAWDAVALDHPADPWPLIRSGEIYLRSLDAPEQALDRFRRARDLPATKPEQQRYAAQRMIDAYLGPLRDEGRAMVELRRLIEQHPGTREAQGARMALRKLKGP